MHTVLQFDYADIHGLAIVSCRGIGRLICDDGTWAYDEVLIYIVDGSAISISVLDDTDELLVKRVVDGHNAHSDHDNSDVILGNFSKMVLGWCWVGVNWRGYKDMFTLSFSTLEPQVTFLGEASKVHVYRLIPGTHGGVEGRNTE